MTDDFKYNGIKKTNNIAIGIDIPDENMRGKGIGVKALKEYLRYFKKLGYLKYILKLGAEILEWYMLPKK